MATIINEYKREFVWKRFLQTVFGGPKFKLGYHAPTYVYINQISLFVLPFLIGGIFTLLVEFDVVKVNVACYVYGGIIIVFVLIGQVLSHFIQKNSNNVTRLGHNVHVLSEEDEIEFDSCLGSDTLNFVLPVKKINVNILIHALLSGPLCGVGLWYLLPSMTLTSLFNHVGATIVLYIFGWFTVCVAQYSLTVTSPAEPVTFRSTDPYELRPLMRPFYVYIFLAFHVVHWYDTDFELVNEVLHVVFIFLPLLWTLALLPPLDALFLWLMEQCVVIFGGSPMAGDLRLIVMFLASCSSFVVIYFLPSSEAITITAACFGYFLSLDHASLINQIITKVMKKDSTKKSSANHEPPKVHIGFGWQWTAKEFIFHLFILAIIGGIAVGVSLSASDFSPTVSKAVGYAVLGLAVFVIILGEMQSVYMMFGMWRNYLYPHSIMEMDKYTKAKSLLIKVAVLRRIIVDFVGPFLMLFYLCMGFAPDPVTLPSFKFTLGVIRSLRWVWQGTFNSMVEISVVHIINQTLTPSSGWWYDLGLSAQLLFTGLLWNRLHQLVHKLTCYFTILVTSYTYEKQRLKHSTLIIILSAIFFPIILFVIIFAAFLSTPLLPVFTLPIILIAFPRPIKSWPGEVGGSANTCQDSIYYMQLSPKLALALKNCCTSGSLGNLSAGAHFLARFQDRMTWLQVLECGYGYCCISIKGMELQETSCHTEEAAKIDDFFESSFNREDGFPFFTFNRDPFHVLTPVDAIPVDTYSSAKTVLTGVIDSPDTLRSIGKNFWKSLIWVLLQHITHREKIPSSKTTSPRHMNHFEANGIDRGSVNSRAALIEFKGNKSILDIKGENDEKDSGRATGETPRPATAASRKSGKSLASSWGSLNSWNDNESMDKVPFNKSGNKIPLSNLSREKTIPGMVDVEENDEDDLESILKDLAIGLPPVDIGNINERKTTQNMSDILTKTGSIKLAGSIQFSSSHSSKLSLPLKWRDIPLDSHQISHLLSDFPKDWYRHVLQHLNFSSGVPSSDVVEEIMSDEALTSIYTQLVSAIFAVVNILGLSGVDFVTRGPMHVFKVFNGDIPWSMSLDWLTQDDELYDLVIKAYRFAVKLSFDEVLYGETSDNDEVREYFDEYQADWYMGVETNAMWTESVLKEKPHLFSIGCNTSQHPPVFTSHILSRQPVMVSIGRLNAEIVRSLWASLSMELFYFTNDDEERYSIQAHPTILRNLTVQSADPPLGYPIFYSKPISIPTF